MFDGRVADVDASASEVQLQVKSGLEMLNLKLLRILYAASCGHTLYDDGCRLARGEFLVTGEAGEGSGRRFIAAALERPAGYFDLGAVRFTSGRNAEQLRTVRSHGDEGVEVLCRRRRSERRYRAPRML
jgi:hypothetical protein